MTVRTPARIIPGPKPMPVLNWRGNYWQFMNDPVQYLYRLYKSYGPLCGFVETLDHQRLTINGFGPDYNQLLLTNVDLFHTRSLSVDAGEDTPLGRLGVGLPVMNGAHHRQQRRLLMPAFHKKHLESYHNEMVSITEQVLARWTPGETRNMAYEMQELTLRIVVTSLFGLDHQLAESLGHQLEAWLKLNISSGYLPLDWPSLPMRRLRNLSQDLETLILGIITERRANAAQNHDVLSMLLQAKDEDGTGMTDHEMLGQVNMLFLAGTETSSNALAWTLFLLAQHPDILGDLVDELQGTLGGSAPTMEQLSKMPLLDHVIKESLRLLPPASFATRKSTDDFEIGPYHLVKGSVVLYSPFITHRLPDLYTHAARFMPQRWQTIEPGPYEYLPFGSGTRMCIGAHFAVMEMKIILSLLLQRVHLALVPNARIDRKEIVTLMLKHGLPMTIHSQDRQFSRVAIRGNLLEMIDIPDVSSRHSVWSL
ncbi:cytochrome P450 [bacterium]|nr:cytochrome P450 [bacterium]